MEVHVLASGSDGNCTVIRSDGEAIMIDAGISCKRIMSKMELHGIDKKEIKAILITHEHTDHVGGAGATARKFGVPIIANEATFNESNLGNVDFQPFSAKSCIDIGSFHVTPLPTSHNAVEPNCYFTEVDDKKVLVATDTGMFSYQIMHALKEADIAVVEANYDADMLINGPYPRSLKKLIGSDHGHMCNVDTGIAIRDTISDHKRKIFLAHLSRTNNTPDIAKETVAEITRISKAKLDCLDGLDDTRIIRVQD